MASPILRRRAGIVIASAAKQSPVLRKKKKEDCFVVFTPRNDTPREMPPYKRTDVRRESFCPALIQPLGGFCENLMEEIKWDL